MLGVAIVSVQSLERARGVARRRDLQELVRDDGRRSGVVDGVEVRLVGNAVVVRDDNLLARGEGERQGDAIVRIGARDAELPERCDADTRAVAV